MIKRRERKAFFAATNGASVVLGFVLILGILLSSFALFFSLEVPEWTKEFEAEHAAQVPQDFAELGATVDAAVLTEDPSASAACPIGIIPQSVPVLGFFASGGTVDFNPDEEVFECIAASPEQTESSGSDSWNTFNFTPFANDSYHVKVTSSQATLEPEIKEDNIIDNDTIMLVNCYDCYYDQFVVKNNATLTIKGGAIKIHATKIIIEEGAKITADGEGWNGGAPEETGFGKGGGLGGEDYLMAGAGGGFGGAGGDGGSNPDSGGIEVVLEEVMGSGGGGGGDWKETSGQPILGSGGNGGNGGGLIWLEASTIDISGTLSANGAYGEGEEQYVGKGGFFKGAGGGGGSGGRLLIKGDTVSITGDLHARGGKGGQGNSNFGAGGGGGGGGVVEVYYGSSISPGIDVILSNTNVSNGVGGTGSSNGFPGDMGQKAVYSAPFFAPIMYYTSGYLVSNMTQIQGQVGYDTNHYLIEYGNLTYDANIRPGTDVVVKVRTAMNPNMADARPWEKCPPVPSGHDISDISSVSDGHRFIQWRAELLTFNPGRTPTLYSINITYEYGEQPVLARSSGRIEFGSQYLYLPNYKLIYAYGATLKNQKHSEGSEFIMLSPPFTITKDSAGNPALSIATVNLTGRESTISGGLSTTIRAAYQDTALVTDELKFYNLTLNLTTSYPTAWEKWFNETCGIDAGLSYGKNPGNYYITKTGNTVQIIFYGNESKPVSLWLKRSKAKIDIFK